MRIKLLFTLYIIDSKPLRSQIYYVTRTKWRPKVHCYPEQLPTEALKQRA